MNSPGKEIIELHPEKADKGEIRYSFSSKPPDKPGPFNGLLAKILGTALGIGVFLFLIVFFVYVVLPLIAVVIVWFLLRSIFRGFFR